MPKKTEIDHYTDKEALDFHVQGKSGKIEINSSKPLTTKRDLSLAYSPGVAAPVKEIAKNPDLAYDYTSKGNLVAVISNGSAILGLGNLGSLASKPVMEGKSVLFKRFADIDSIDIEIDNKDSESIIETITINIPNNTFLYYLRFSLNYASAKSVETKFQLTKDELSDDEQVFFSTSQQTYLKLAKKDLESIAKLNKYCQEKRSSIQVNGNEYSLGQDVFRKMPASANLDILKEHLSSLIDETNTISTTTIR